MYFNKIYLSTEFWLEWLLLLFKLFINNDIRAFGLSQYVAMSVTEVSDVDVHFTEAVLILILYQQHSPTDYLLVLTVVDHIDIAGFSHHVMGQMFIKLTFLMQHTGSRICHLSLRKRYFDLF